MTPDPVTEKWGETIEGKMVIAKYSAGRRAFEQAVFLGGAMFGMFFATILLFFVPPWVICGFAVVFAIAIVYLVNKASGLYHDAMDVVQAEETVTPSGDKK